MPVAHELSVGSYTAEGGGLVMVGDRSDKDLVYVGDVSPGGPPLDGLAPVQFQLVMLEDDTSSALAGDAIPVLTEFTPITTQEFALLFSTPVPIGIRGDLTVIEELALDPEPVPTLVPAGKGALLILLLAVTIGVLQLRQRRPRG